jgi:hypothetical protein
VFATSTNPGPRFLVVVMGRSCCLLSRMLLDDARPTRVDLTVTWQSVSPHRTCEKLEFPLNLVLYVFTNRPSAETRTRRTVYLKERKRPRSRWVLL